jgi:hypothetical protein
MRSVAHIEAEDIGALLHELAHHFRAFRRRSECADDLGAAHFVIRVPAAT